LRGKNVKTMDKCQLGEWEDISLGVARVHHCLVDPDSTRTQDRYREIAARVVIDGAINPGRTRGVERAES